jgi:hypothetical protein
MAQKFAPPTATHSAEAGQPNSHSQGSHGVDVVLDVDDAVPVESGVEVVGAPMSAGNGLVLVPVLLPLDVVSVPVPAVGSGAVGPQAARVRMRATLRTL